jgi:hypothetical protein
LPFVHGTLLQQSEACVQFWPYSAHWGPLSVPASGMMTGGGPQVPLVDPGAATHGSPAQQSASDVQAPLVGTQSLPPQMNAEPPSPAAAFGKHGRPQQSALLAHA